jgi:23S rRNA (pseudouridine1915-N3)-methyltransferase
LVRLLLVTVGKPRAGALGEAAREYMERLQRYGGAEWVTVAGEDVAPRAGPGEVEVALGKEADRVLSRLPPGSLTVALDRAGREWSSLELAEALSGWQQRERQVAFVVGSAFGLHARVLAQARLRLSLSRLTLPHELAGVVLLEQLYRAHTILRREPYHK